MYERDDYDDRFATPAEAVTEWRYAVGADRPDREWLLSDYDTWEKNPYYRGKPGPHPEDPPPPEEGVECLAFNLATVGAQVAHEARNPPYVFNDDDIPF